MASRRNGLRKPAKTRALERPSARRCEWLPDRIRAEGLASDIVAGGHLPGVDLALFVTESG